MMYPNLINQMMSDGIFNDLQRLDVPWADLNIQSALNYGYYLHSANKLVSPFVFDLTDAIEDVHTEPYEVQPLTQVERNIIALTIYTTFNKKWSRLWDIFNIEYNPLYNYVLTENETIENEGQSTGHKTGTQTTVTDTDIRNTGTDTLVTDRTIANTGTDTHNITKNETDGGTESVQKQNTKTNTGTDTVVTDTDTTNTGTVGNVTNGTTTDGLWGFNSDTAVNSDTSTGSETGTRTDNLAGTLDTTETETQNLQEVNNGTDTTTRNLTHTATNTDTNTKNLSTDEDTTETQTKNLSTSNDTTETRTDNLINTISDTGSSERNLTKNGNIGFNTPQEMLVSDLELWQWNFFKSVFDDIDSVLTMCIY